MSKPARDQVLGHADEADGIEEYDNPLPDWWVGLFWLTILWGVGYGVWFHFIGKVTPEARLAAELAAADARWPTPAGGAAATVEITPASVEAGKQVYAQACVGCHGQNLEGGIGPSLSDTTWIHGATKAAILATITHGVTEKGMPAWGPMLGPEKVNQVAAYVIEHNGRIVE